jgi:hypothetical protein
MVRDALSYRQSRSDPPVRLGPALPAALFERNDITIICEKVHYFW